MNFFDMMKLLGINIPDYMKIIISKLEKEKKPKVGVKFKVNLKQRKVIENECFKNDFQRHLDKTFPW